MRTICFLVCWVAALTVAAYAEEIRYITHIKPLFDQKCAGCHGSNAPEFGEFEKDKEKYKQMFKGPKMDSYAHLVFFTGWPDTGALMRRLDDGTNTKDNKPGNMYQYLGSTEDERKKNLGLFKDWVGNWTLKRTAEVTREDLSAIRVRY